MSGALRLPPAGPPDEAMSRVLGDLRLARRELEDAGRVMRMLEVDRRHRPTDPHSLRWQRIEQEVAERRGELWAAEVRRLEDEARALGARP
jgi:hypothetical protein